MRLAALTLALLALSAARAAADDGWQKAFSFPQTSNSDQAGRATAFTDPADGLTYAYFGADTANGAQIWRSSDAIDWNQVNVNGFGTKSGKPLYSGVAWITTYVQNSSTWVYVGVTPNSSLDDGPAIYRSSGGASTSQWTQVMSSVTLGSVVATEPGGLGASFQGSFYFGTDNPDSGTHVWKSTSADSLGSWFVVASSGFGEGAGANLGTTYLKPFGGDLYLATDCALSGGQPCGQIWRSTGTVNPTDKDTWVQVLVATDTFDPNTYAVTALESFNGALYAATLNSSGHAQVFYSATPDVGPWTAVSTPDSACGSGNTLCFASGTSTAVQSLRAIGGYLYAATWNSPNGLVIYRSADGTTWTRSNAVAGFGTTDNQYLGDFVPLATTVLGDSYNTSGGALWKALLPGAPGSPGTPAAVAVDISSIGWTWAAAPSATSYNVFEATSPTTFLGTTVSSSFTWTNLSTNTLYGIAVAGVNGVGQGLLVTSPLTATLSAPPTSFALAGVFASSITLTWGANGNAAGTTYQVQYWQAAGATMTATTTNASLTLTGLLDGSSYYMTVGALNSGGLNDPSGTVLEAFTTLVPELSAVIGPPGGTILFNTPSGVASLTIPAGAYQQDVTVTLSTPSSFPTAPSPSGSLTPTGVGLQVDVSPSIEPDRTSLLTVSYTAAEMLGFDVAQLSLARYDDVDNVWVPLASSRSSAAQQVTGATDHLSPFQIMVSQAGAAVGSARAFPNPMRPALGETYMTFSLLPPNARVRVYTLTGVLVKDLTADGTGTVDWDGTNQAGAQVASGVYFVFATGGGQNRTFKVAIQR